MTAMQTALIALGLLVCVASSAGTTLDGSRNQTEDTLECPPLAQARKNLRPECRPFVVFNLAEWSQMSTGEQLGLAKFCACQIAQLDFGSAFITHPAVMRVFNMVKDLEEDYKTTSVAESSTGPEHASEPKNLKGPTQVWSLTDLIESGYSIYLSTRDFFSKKRQDDSWSWLKESDFRTNPLLRDLRFVCFMVANDKLGYYQYLENLERISPLMFFQVLRLNADIETIFHASRACKLFLLHRINDFRLKPESQDFYAVDTAQLRAEELEALNAIALAHSSTGHLGGQLDSDRGHQLAEVLREASVQFVNCRRHWSQTPSRRSSKQKSLVELRQECPMMLNETTPLRWFEDHPDPIDRSQVALKCGCQLLQHNSTWAEILDDPNVQIMSKTFTNYVQLHPLPNERHQDGEMPTTREYFGWFENVMKPFAKSKRMAIEEVVKFRQGDEDPSNEINTQTHDEEQALELLRLGCNRIMFNHVKGSARPADDIELIKYLDNLRLITQDPLFVFHLTLQDDSLFKIYALSKMCAPIIR